MTSDGDYDWWASEGRPEHLRPLEDAGVRMFDDPALRDAGVAVFSTGVDLERELLQVEVAAADGPRARSLITERYGDRVEVDVVASAEYVVEDVPWESWTAGATEHELTVWLLDSDDGSQLATVVAEDAAQVTVTLRGPRYQGAVAAVGIVVSRPVRLARPRGGRPVVDGATGRRRPERPLRD